MENRAQTQPQTPAKTQPQTQAQTPAQTQPQTQPDQRPLVGAIRWDAWHGVRGGPGLAVERSLGPAKYHYRLPFFAKVLAEDKVEIRGDNQEVMDREIAYAKGAGIDYWAFVTYDPGTSMSIGLEQYLASTHRQDVKFCLIIEQGRLGNQQTHAEKTARIIELMCQPTYVKVMGNRPLLYLGFIEPDKVVKLWGPQGASQPATAPDEATKARAWKAFADSIKQFRAAAAEAHLGDPYIVIMDFSTFKAADYATKLGAQAVSAYAVSGGTSEGRPFEELRQKAAGRWDAYAQTGKQVIPLAPMGWDPRPRVDNPVPWTKPNDKHYETSTPAQAAAQVRDAMDWVAAHAGSAQPRAIIIYAWNENDEGGWIVPTLNPDGSANTDRLDAIGQAIKSFVGK